MKSGNPCVLSKKTYYLKKKILTCTLCLNKENYFHLDFIGHDLAVVKNSDVDPDPVIRIPSCFNYSIADFDRDPTMYFSLEKILLNLPLVHIFHASMCRL